MQCSQKYKSHQKYIMTKKNIRARTYNYALYSHEYYT